MKIQQGPAGTRIAGAWLALLFLFHSFLLVSWLRRDARPPRWDQSVHLSTAWDYKDAIASFSPLNLARVRPRPGHPAYPPLVHYVMVPFLAASHVLPVPPEDAAACANLLFMAVLGAAAYVLASRWWGRVNGVCAAFFVTLPPTIWQHAREPLVDLSLAAWVTASYACWVRSENFSDRRWSLALGACAAAGMLSKWSFPFYVLPILAAAGYRAWKAPEVRRSVLLSGVLAGVLSLPWYTLNAPTVLPRVLKSASMGGAEGDPSVWSLGAWTWYAKATADQLHGVFAALGAAGLAALAVRRGPGWKILLGWILSSYVFWSFVSNKNERYLIPFVVALPLAAAALPKRVAAPAAGLALVFSGWLWKSPAESYAAPQAGTWPLEAVVARAQETRDPSFPISILTVAANHDYINGTNMAWIVQKTGTDGTILPRGKLKRLGEFSEFVLVKTGEIGPEYASVRQRLAREEALAANGWFQNAFAEVGRWDLPDGGQAVLFQRRVLPHSGGLTPTAALPDLFPDASFEGLSSRRLSSGPASYEVAADSVSIKGLTLTHLRARLEGFHAVPDDAGRPRLLGLDRLELTSALLTGDALRDFVKKRVRNLQDVEAAFLPDGRLRVRGVFGAVPIEFEGGIRYHPERASAPLISVEIIKLRLAKVPLPVALLGGLRRREIALEPAKGLPFFLTVSSLSTDPEAAPNGALRIGS